ncbi:B12-binding domain-containing radical SAM protein [Adlercreutzia equolifaciens subsp. celatus]|nr:B12-binding domain-containing radical SAM protein [Adlercreutzia equolifaciens subsp. celatus]
MKVFFVNPPFKAEHGKFARENRSAAITRSGTLYYPLWLIYAAAVCEKDGFDVEFLDAPATPLDYGQSMEAIDQRGAETRLFVVDTSTPSIYSDIAFADALKEKYPEAYVMLVGTHPSALPEETLGNARRVDAVALKEFDYIVRDVARALRDGGNPSDVLGLAWCDEARNVTVNDPYPFITDLDEIPFAAEFVKKHLDERDYFFAASAYPEIQIFTGRGCPAHCTFCVYPQTMHGHRYRLRSAENVVDEFQYIADNFPDVKEVVIEDDTFTIDKRRVATICEMLIERGLSKKLRWLCNARVNLDYDTMVLMRKAGCHLIIPGIESGSQEILDNIRKGTTLEQVERYMADAKRAKIKVHACYMVGNRGETRETMQQTLDLAMRLKADTAQFYPLLPFPGTEAYRWAKENDYIRGDYSDYVKEDGTINALLELPGLTAEEMVSFCDDARKRYYWRPGYILHRLCVGLTDPEDLKRSIKAFGRIKDFLIK